VIIRERMEDPMQGSEQILYGFERVRNCADYLQLDRCWKTIAKKSHRLCFLFFIGFLILFFKPAAAQHSSVTLAWAANMETNLSRYIMYRDTIPGTMKYLNVIPKSDTVYVDTSIVAGKTYYYKLTATDSNGYESSPSNEVEATVGISKVGEDGNHVVEGFKLKQNYPNPFNPTTNIPYTLSRNSRIKIIIYDMLGSEIRTLVDEFKVVGSYQTIWDGKNNNGRNVSSGVYFYQMTAENYAQVKKLILQK
jgi:hypothetical protein